ncbi:MAG TPA: hypothetical protein VGM29_00135 [Polyangiaceae bacterium]|jgi:hypothetical protein
MTKPSLTTRQLTRVAFAGMSVAIAGCSSSDKAATPVSAPATLSITDPSDGAMIALIGGLTDGSDYSLVYTTENFTIAAPGACAGKTSPCGHARVWVDDMACNDMDDKLPYNVEGASPLDVGFDYCAGGIPGAHTIRVELHGDNGDLFTDPATGMSVSATVGVTITQGGGAGGTGG